MPPPIEYPLSLLSVNQADPYPEWYICNREYDESGTDCLCGKENIKDCIWIQNRYTGRQQIVGSSCMQYFGDVKPLCVGCAIYPAATATATLCVHCRGGKRKEPSFTVKFGKYKNASYEDVWQDKQYTDWICSLPSFADKHLQAFLKQKRKLDRSRWITKREGSWIHYTFPDPASLRI